jgi:molybdopterin-binding protein
LIKRRRPLGVNPLPDDAALRLVEPVLKRRCVCKVGFMPHLRITEAAALLGVSDDTVRRMVDAGRLAGGTDEAGRRTVDGAQLAAVAQELAHPAAVGAIGGASARNRMRGIVTAITRDTVMAKVEMQCGPFRIVSLLSSESVDDLGLEVGSVAVASVKSTHVVVEVPA